MKTFFSLIDQLNNTSDHSDDIKAEIWRNYGSYKAVLALDMSGFSSTVRREGIISYLAQIRKMQLLTQPLITQHQGEVVKYEADNLLLRPIMNSNSNYLILWVSLFKFIS